MTGDVEAILETGAAAAVEAAASALAARGGNAATCASCASPLLGPYCAVCGQPRLSGHRSVHELLYAFVKDVVNFDSRIMRTARALLIEPGELPKAFREGRTQPFVPAIRLYLFVTLVFFVLLSVTKIAILQIDVTAKPVKVVYVGGNAFIPNPAYNADTASDPDVRGLIKPLLPISKERASQPGGVFVFDYKAHFFAPIGRYHAPLPDAARRQLQVSSISDSKRDVDTDTQWYLRKFDTVMGEIAADPAALNEPLTTWIPRALFLLLPLYALLLALFHIRRRKDFYLVDHVVFSFSIHTFAFVVLMAAVGLAQVVPGGIVAWAVFIGMSIYVFLAMKRFYAQGWVKTTLKFVLISAIYAIFFLAPALAAVLALSIFGGNLG
ncbi:MAG TPA: DUF3667 domain-containing protein [Rhizomicrobium sp.]|jgi:hypothetical protein|nr:DUF3667 domain-containing protein [Rhizomicrobium sp.]